MYGLLERDLNWIVQAVSSYPEIEEVIIFGSRAMGNYKNGSDVDIALKGKDITEKIVRRVNDDLNEKYPIPYFFDTVNYEEVSNKELKQHIDKWGKTIYGKLS